MVETGDFSKLYAKHPYVTRKGLPRAKREWEGETVAIHYMVKRGHRYKFTKAGWKFGTLIKAERDEHVAIRDNDGKVHNVHYTRVFEVFNTQRYIDKKENTMDPKLTATLFICGTFPNYLKRDEEGNMRLWVYKSETLELKSKVEVDDLVAATHEDAMSVRFLLIRLSTGEKYTYKQVDEGTDGIKNGSWHWEEMKWKEGVKVILVKNPNHCTRCNGEGEVTFGGVNYILKHGINRRGCFQCHGLGVNAWKGEK